MKKAAQKWIPIAFDKVKLSQDDVMKYKATQKRAYLIEASAPGI